MTEKNFVPETQELAEEALEQVAGGEGWILLDPNDANIYMPEFIPNQEKK